MSEGLVVSALAFLRRLLDGLEIVAILDHLDVPVVGLEALGDVLGEGELGGSVERDEVVVVEDDQLAEAEGSGERAASCEMPSIRSPSPQMT